jgi:Do/DeqQ family serine protease
MFSKYQGAQDGTAFPSFVSAVDIAKPAVVHIKSTFGNSRKGSWGFFGDSPSGGGMPESMGSGSGVIISASGYIATNNHVVENATEIEVLLTDNRKYKADVIGTDPSTDLALLKIEDENLPFIEMGNSDDIKIGEWVIAIGNPLEFSSTVTAGIVSAKGRDLRLLEGQYRIESFIQTDAAVNPGNSGGALVDVNGKLVGINTAIASRTGLYAGYSFAVPSILVQKVMDDLLKFGEVRRGLLGITIENVDAEKAETHELATLQGAYVSQVGKGSGAEAAGLRTKDVIVAINGKTVNNTAELQEQIGRCRAGDKVKVKFLRGSEEKVAEVTLKKIQADDPLTASPLRDKIIEDEEDEPTVEDKSGSSENSFRKLSQDEMNLLGITNGVKVENASRNLTIGGVKPGFVITKINGKTASSPEIVEKELKASQKTGMVSLEGLYKKGVIASYQFTW